MTIEFNAVYIPIAFTILPIFWAIFIVKDNGGFASGLGNVLALVPALFVSMLSWIVYACFK